jgi:hypothetical protein
MGGKEIETDEQQKNKPDQPKAIMKPLVKAIHWNPLACLVVAGLKGKETCPFYRGKRLMG